MTADDQVETVTSGADKAKLGRRRVLLVGGAAAAFCSCGQARTWMRVGVVGRCCSVAASCLFTASRAQASGRSAATPGARREEGRLADPQGGDADDRLRVRLRGRDGAVPLADRQDARNGYSTT
jgi:hypothetical protein